MIACQLSDELIARHRRAKEEWRPDETWEMAMAHRAAAALAWAAVEEHRAKCWRCAALVGVAEVRVGAAALP